MTNLPCCQFPTSALIVDDNEDYLASLCLLMNNYNPIKIESNPHQAISIILNQYLKGHFIQECIYSLDSTEFDYQQHPLLGIDIRNLCTISNKIERFSAITLLIDYSMPLLNGYELCRKLQDTPVKKIMITGESDLNIAIKAFNDGIIDKFILKNSPTFTKDLSQAMQTLQENFFVELSKQLTDKIITPENIWGNKNFYYFMQSIKRNFNAVEFYLLDHHGSYLFLDAKGSPTIIAVQSLYDINRQYHIAYDNNAPTEIIAKLFNKSMALP